MNFSWISSIVDKLVGNNKDADDNMTASKDKVGIAGVDVKEHDKRVAKYRYIGSLLKNLSAGPFLIDRRADISLKDEQYFAEFGHDRKGPLYEEALLGTKIPIGDLKGHTVVFCGRPLTAQDLCISSDEDEDGDWDGDGDGDGDGAKGEGGAKSKAVARPQLTSHYISWVRVPDDYVFERERYLPEIHDYWHGLRPALFVLLDDKDPRTGLFYTASPFTEAMFMKVEFDVALRCKNMITVRDTKIPLIPFEQMQKKAKAKINNTGKQTAVEELKTKIDSTPPSKANKKPVHKPAPAHVGPRMFPGVRFENSTGDPGVFKDRFLRNSQLLADLNPESAFQGNIASDVAMALVFDTDKVVDVHPETARIEGMMTDDIEYDEIDRNQADEDVLAQILMKKQMKKKQEEFDAKFKQSMIGAHAIYGHLNWGKVKSILHGTTAKPSLAVHEVAHLYFKLGAEDTNLLAYRNPGKNRMATVNAQSVFFEEDNSENIESAIQNYLSGLDKENRENPLPSPWIHDSDKPGKKGSAGAKSRKKAPLKSESEKTMPNGKPPGNPPGKPSGKPSGKPPVAPKNTKKASGKSEKGTGDLDSFLVKEPQHKKEDTKDAPSHEDIPEPPSADSAPAAAPEPKMGQPTEDNMSANEEDAFKALMTGAKTTGKGSPAPAKDSAKDSVKEKAKENTKKNAKDASKEAAGEAPEDAPKSAKGKKPTPKADQKEPAKDPEANLSDDSKGTSDAAAKSAKKPKAAPKPKTGGKEAKPDAQKDNKRPAEEPAKDESGPSVPPAKKTKVAEENGVSFATIDEGNAKIKDLKQKSTNAEKQKTKLSKEIDTYKAKVAQYKSQIVELEQVIESNTCAVANHEASINEAALTIPMIEKTIKKMKDAEEQEAKRKLLQKRQAEEPAAKDAPAKPPAKKARKATDGDQYNTVFEFVDAHTLNFIQEHGDKALEQAMRKGMRDKLLLSETKSFDSYSKDERKRLAPVATYIANYAPKEYIPAGIEKCAALTKSNVVKHIMGVLASNRELLVKKNPLKKYEDFQGDEEKKAYLRNLSVAFAAFVLRYQQLHSILSKKDPTPDDDGSDSDLDDFI